MSYNFKCKRNNCIVIELTFSDMALIQCLIMTSGALKENERWVPLCMPGISADGFLQLYSNF